MEHPFLMFLDHTQRRSTVGRTPLDKLITRSEESYRLCYVVVCDLETSRMCAPYIYDISHLRVKHSTCPLAKPNIQNHHDSGGQTSVFHHKGSGSSFFLIFMLQPVSKIAPLLYTQFFHLNVASTRRTNGRRLGNFEKQQ